VHLTVPAVALILLVDGRQKLTLAAVNATTFAIPGGAGTITFAKADGGVTYEVTRSNGQIVKWIRLP
jgi:hypothetical protein